MASLSILDLLFASSTSVPHTAPTSIIKLISLPSASLAAIKCSSSFLMLIPKFSQPNFTALKFLFFCFFAMSYVCSGFFPNRTEEYAIFGLDLLYPRREYIGQFSFFANKSNKATSIPEKVCGV